MSTLITLKLEQVSKLRIYVQFLLVCSQSTYNATSERLGLLKLARNFAFGGSANVSFEWFLKSLEVLKCAMIGTILMPNDRDNVRNQGSCVRNY